MTVTPARVLCIGQESDLLQLRCAVLSRSGFSAQSVQVRDALKLLHTESFDLIIISAQVSDEDRGWILGAIGNAAILVLNGVTLPAQLLAEVEQRLELVGRAG